MLFKICDPEAVRIPAIGNCALVKGDARRIAVSFPSNWLFRTIQHQPSEETPEKATKPPSEALITSIRSNIRSNISDPNSGIELLVAQMGFNRRDVQKCLRDRGSGLADLIEEERKALACDYLSRGGHSLDKVARALGYTDVSNFSRAFRR